METHRLLMLRRGLVVVCVLLGACGGSRPRPSDPARAFGDAIAANDATGAAALFAPDAELAIVAGPSARGRAAIGSAISRLGTRFPGLQVVTGRRWTRGTTHVIELVMTAKVGPRPIGVPAVAIATLDGAGLVSAARIYIDVPTLVGQLAPDRLPEGITPRAPIASPLTGTVAITASGSPEEAQNFATTGAIWARLDAHDPAGVLAPSAPGYIYDDYSGPAPLDLAGTRKLLDGFMGLVQDFTIVEKPTYFAAGSYVITEAVEHMKYQGALVTLHGVSIKEFAGGRVVREWQYANGAEVLRALLGIVVEVPAPE